MPTFLETNPNLDALYHRFDELLDARSRSPARSGTSTPRSWAKGPAPYHLGEKILDQILAKF